jgi:hypothetical protein
MKEKSKTQRQRAREWVKYHTQVSHTQYHKSKTSPAHFKKKKKTGFTRPHLGSWTDFLVFPLSGSSNRPPSSFSPSANIPLRFRNFLPPKETFTNKSPLNHEFFIFFSLCGPE